MARKSKRINKLVEWGEKHKDDTAKQIDKIVDKFVEGMKK